MEKGLGTQERMMVEGDETIKLSLLRGKVKRKTGQEARMWEGGWLRPTPEP